MNEWPKELQEIYGLEPLETDVLYPGQSNLINFEGKEYPVHDYCETLINCTGKSFGYIQYRFLSRYTCYC